MSLYLSKHREFESSSVISWVHELVCSVRYPGIKVLSDDIPEMAEQTDVHNLVTGKLPIILAHSGQIQTLTISQQTANQTRSDQAGDLPGATGIKKTVIPGRVCQRNPRRHPAM